VFGSGAGQLRFVIGDGPGQLRLALGDGPCELCFVIDEGLRELCFQRAEHLAMDTLLFLQRELLLLGQGPRLVGDHPVVGGAECFPVGDRFGELRLHAAEELELAEFLFVERLALIREQPGLIGHQRLAGRSNGFLLRRGLRQLLVQTGDQIAM
jgi:hypothetical protein